jgi:hypothetical protein
MPEIYVTLFDSLFIPQGLALYHSLVAHAGPFRLWVLCIDDQCYDFLSSINLSSLHLLSLSSLENEKLLSVKSARSRSEYCWTLTPWAIQWALEADISASRITYLDSDTYFLQSPATIFNDLDRSGRSFLVTSHSYSPSYDQTATSGKYCVQFVPVQRGRGEYILHWWRDRCIEWCFARFENGKFGDQKYIEEITEIFQDDVLVLDDDRRFVAPWNSNIFRFSDAVLYHFQGFRIITPYFFVIHQGYLIPLPLLKYVYRPYFRLIRGFCSTYKAYGFALKPQLTLSFSNIVMLMVGVPLGWLYLFAVRVLRHFVVLAS